MGENNFRWFSYGLGAGVLLTLVFMLALMAAGI